MKHKNWFFMIYLIDLIILKIAIFVTDSDFDETSFIGSVTVNYNNVSSFIAIGLVVWSYGLETPRNLRILKSMWNFCFFGITSSYDRIWSRNFFHRVQNILKHLFGYIVLTNSTPEAERAFWANYRLARSLSVPT